MVQRRGSAAAGAEHVSGRVLHATRNTLDEAVRKEVCELLGARLLEAVDLFTMIKQAHWNVRGENFIGLHKLFDKIAEEAEEWGDLIAERARQLGGEALGTARVVAAGSTLEEYPAGIFDSPAHVAALADRLAAFGERVRKSSEDAERAGDKATADLFTEVNRGVDESLWFVESHEE